MQSREKETWMDVNVKMDYRFQETQENVGE